MLRHQKIRSGHLAALPSEKPHLRSAATVTSISILLIAAALLIAGTSASNAVAESDKRTTECLPPPDGIVSWWRGEDGRDEQAVNHLTLQGSVNIAAGKVGNAFSFDDGGDFAQVSQPLGLPVGNAPRTIELWFRTPIDLTSSTESALIQYGTAAGGQMFGLVTSGNAPGKLYFYGHSADTWSATTILPNTWYHGAVTYDGTTLKLYMNGQLETSTALGLNTVLDPNGLTIGYRHSGSQWTGEIDEPTIYDRALTDAEVLAIFNADSAGKCMANCVPAPAGLIGWWPAESNANDIIGGNDGLVEGNITFPFGKVARTFNFDGTTGDVIVPAASSIDVGTGPGMTIDMWIRPSSVTQMPLAEFSNANLMGAHLFIGAPAGNSGNLFANLRDTAGSSHYIQSANGLVNTQQWQHVAVTYDKTSGIAALYLNGVVVAGPSNIGSFTPDTQYDFNMGYRPSGPARYVGEMDEVELFGRALTTAEVAAIYNAGSAGKCKGCAEPPAEMTAWWPGEGNANDIQGPPYENGAMQGNAGFSLGMVGRSFNFSGAQADFVEIPNTAVFNPQTGFTVDGWFYIDPAAPGNAGEIATLVGKSEGSTGNGWTLYFDDRGSHRSLKFSVGGLIEAVNAIPTAGWYHIAGTWDPAAMPRSRIYVNGVSVVDSGAMPWGILHNSLNVRIGAMHWTDFYGQGNDRFNGKADEVEFISRTLSQTEIAALYNAGSVGKCRTCAPAPAQMISWWPGDGDANDIQGPTFENGSLVNGATYAAGKVDQAFLFNGVDSYFRANNTTSIDGGPQATYDAWVYPTAVPEVGTYFGILGVGDSTFSTWLPQQCRLLYWRTASSPPGTAKFYIDCGLDNNENYFSRMSAGDYPTNAWHFVVGTFNNGTLNIYVNGVLDNGDTAGTGGSIINTTSNDYVWMGAMVRNDGSLVTVPFAGMIDEAEIFDRALTSPEIQAIHNAGSAGKCKPSTPTPTQTPTPTPTLTPTPTPPTPTPSPTPTPTPLYTRGDFDGDNKTDASVYRPDGVSPNFGVWYMSLSTGGFYGVQFGIATDVITPADFDGDSKTDVAVARLNSNGMDPDFYVMNSATNTFSYPVWGNPGDVPVCADYDGDRKADIAVWRPLVGRWFIQNSTGGVTAVNHGQIGDKPVPMDFDGDGKANIAYFRPSTGDWVIRNASGSSTLTVNFGLATDIPVPADYDGDKKVDIAVYRGGMWIIWYSSNAQVAFIPFGTTGDIPVPGDYDADGLYDVAIYRQGVWHMLRSGAGYTGLGFGLGTDIPVPKAYFP